MFQARALYDFQGEPNTAEIDMQAGDIITITRTDVYEGWWEGRNAFGKVGLIPEAYVEKMQDTTSKISPVQQWGAPPPPPVEQNSNQNQDWDDDWDDDTYSEVAPAELSHQQTNDPIYTNENFNQAPDFTTMDPNFDHKGTVSKKSLNRFSPFVKNGGENYLLGNIKVNVHDKSKIYIENFGDNMFQWPQIGEVQSVQITSPKKESKLKGLKSFIAYQLTPSSTNIQVSRRYKHFDWLHERLTEKFILLAIPPLPDKQISGRYEEGFIERRRCQLSEFIDYVCRHPVLSQCDVWQHFLTCTDEKLWKQGKRTAEKDELVGANFAMCIVAPGKTLLPSVYDQLESTKVPFITNMDGNLKNTLSLIVDQSKKFKCLYSKEYQKIGNTFYSLGSAIEYDAKAIPCALSKNIKLMGTAYLEIGSYFDEQPAKDWDKLGDKLYLYKGITTSFQGIFNTCKAAQTKRKEIEKSMNGQTANDVKERSDVFTYITLAELKHFKDERDYQLRDSMMHFVQEQIEFHQRVANRLQMVLDAFRSNC